ncbi:NAD-dependent epimerase/dehydratase family protein [Paracoccus liaowanqingii]|uniref:NAD-dependent epimerase/dehydratase family protein n=1 Tax=Paracoccus liaowanqingii TaxID=2560053 RepID=A0A4Z1BZR9_9RHOB|nr:AMP-binding protein [Paracoccus liaowanqingii]TGN60116.1 NAD-dependent epimerase/dehydratase family protein [Paracoccus liaowanqingii]
MSRSVETTATDDPTAPADLVPAELVRACHAHRGRLALCDRDHRLSYGQLAEFVQVLQGQLSGDGPVALFGAPGSLLAAAAVTCVIGGRPFVHLDPAMPQAVLTNIVAELGVATIVTCQPPAPDQLPGTCRIIDAQTCLNRRPPDGVGPLVAADVRPTDIIYLVATSGTTGRPKCIPVTHDAAWLSYRWRDEFTPYDPSMTVGIYIFAIWEMFRPLRMGAQLQFPGLNDLMSPQALVAFLSRHGIDEMLFTPSFFEKTLGAIDPETGAALPLRRVVLNGEVVSDRLVAEAQRRLPGTVLWNLYSICETHDISITRLDGVPAPAEGVSVGVAMPHLRAVVLDDGDRPCAPGQPGLLHFEGPRMLGPGYVNRPEETAQRFRMLTLDGQDRRLYDTGDRGYVTEDGRIHVLGRIAHMLKLRGHSIQTRELTETLAAHLAFGQAIPWVQQVEGPGQVLVVYYTADAAQRARNADAWNLGQDWQRLPQALALALQQVLPRYCIPTWLARLDEIPINPVSGKCDFKALPPVPSGDGGADGAHDLPTLTCAARILGGAARSIDPTLSFHDQGGDSLMCVDLILSLEAAYGRPVDFEWALNLPLARLHALLTTEAAATAPPGSFRKAGILLTGATGFLGGHVLAEAARHLPEGQVIYCLVRPRTHDPAVRLAAQAAALGVPQDRFVVVAGAIEDPRFGLDPATYADLAHRVSSVVHCAATVNLAVDRNRMEAWSQAGIATILQFCRDAGAPLAFSSSTSIFPDRGGPHPEGPTTAFEGISGYGAAKIAAERAIAHAGIDALFLRLPSLYDLEAPNPKDIYEAILQACQGSGRVPQGLCFRMTDVRAAARLLLQSVPAGVTHANLIGEGAVTWPEDAPSLPTIPRAAWLDMAPLTPVERRLLQDNPDTLQADAAYDTATARRLWSALGPYGQVSDPAALLARRLQPDRVPEATTAIPR